jgi:Cdc6-like AAA superfamily ATPase
MATDDDDFDEHAFFEKLKAVGKAFTPSSPVTDRDLFAGRQYQLQTLVVVESQSGQHAIVYGVRGAGKTSLAQVAQSIIGSAVSPYYICSSDDTFKSIWSAIMGSIHITQAAAGLGFNAMDKVSSVNAAQLLPEDVTPHAVVEALRLVSQSTPITIVIDEFDRPRDDNVRLKIADTIKILADRAVRVTVVLVGVADAIDDLLKEHESIQRSLVQIEMPPMTDEELRDVVARGMAAAGLDPASEAFVNEVVSLSQGLPHYTHLMCFHAAQSAVESLRTHVGEGELKVALSRALEDASQSIRTQYHRSTFSNRDTLYKSVLLACAMCDTDEVGSFGAPDVREQLRAITGVNYDIPAFSTHLKDFSSDTGTRGGILKRIGTTRRFRYQFRDPLMPTYVRMRGRNDGLDHPPETTTMPFPSMS